MVTTFVFRVRNLPAALYKALGGFATNGVNMTKLESYMVDGEFFATQFYAEVDGHPEDRDLKRALEELAFFSRRCASSASTRRTPSGKRSRNPGRRALRGLRRPDVLRPEPHADQAGGDPAQEGQAAKSRSTQGGVGFSRLPSVGPMTRFWISTCSALGDARRQLAPPLHRAAGRRRVTRPRRAAAGQDVGRGDRVLDREVDADAADRRHRVRRVADAEQARAGTTARSRSTATVSSLTSSQLAQLADAVGEERRERGDAPRGTPRARAPAAASKPPFGMTSAHCQ